MSTVIGKSELVRQLQASKVERGDLLNLKVSMGSIGYVVGGAKTLVEALVEAVGPEGTIEAQAFVDCYPLPLSDVHAKQVSDRWTPSYAGALANAMIWHPDAFCSTHPIQRFVFIGRRARELAAAHTPESFAYEPLRWMARNGAKSLKIGTDTKVPGVGTTHVAVDELGFRKKIDRRLGVNYYDYRDQTVKLFERTWPTLCPSLFHRFTHLYDNHGAVLWEGSLGDARTFVTSMAGTLQTEVATLRAHPDFLFCGNPACHICQYTWEHSPRHGIPEPAKTKPLQVLRCLICRLRCCVK